MANLHVDVWLTKDRRPPVIRITKDSMMTLDIELHDHEVPSGATIMAYASGKFSDEIYKTPVRRATESMLQMDIPEGFFVPGANYLQIEIKETATSNPITLPLDVDCARRVQEGGTPATPEKVLPLVERAEAAAAKAEQEAAKIPEDVEGQITTLKEALEETDSRLSESITEINDNYRKHHTVVLNSNIYDKDNDIIVGKWIGNNGVYHDNVDSKFARIPVCAGSTISICFGGVISSSSSSSLGGWICLNDKKEVLSVIKAEEHISEQKYNGLVTFSFELPNDCYFVDVTIKLATSWDASDKLIVIYEDAFNIYDGTGTDIYSWDKKTFGSKEESERKRADLDIYQRLKDGTASDTEIVGTPVYENIYNKDTDIVDGYWISRDGSFKPVSSCKYAKIKIVDVRDYGYVLLSLGQNKRVNYSSNSFGGILLQDENGNNVGDVILVQNCEDVADYNGDYCKKIPIRDGAKYILFTAKLATTWDATNTITLRSVADLTDKKISKIFGCEILSDTKYKWLGKKWIAFGDSLTEANLRTTMHYHDYIAEETGITVSNFGRSGTGYKRTEDEGKAFYQRMRNIPTDADVLTIFGSGNDLNYVNMEISDFDTALGNPTDTTTDTICGCVNKTIDVFLELCPTTNIGIITPTPWQNYNPINHDNSMDKYANALVTICKNRGIPCLDLYHCSNLRPWDADFRRLAYSKDDGGGTHPDETGHKIIAPRFKAFLETLLL